MAAQPGQPYFDRDLANHLIGRHVIVGMTYLHHDGSLDRQEQAHRFVVRADEELVAIEVWGTGEMITLPPDLRPFETPAAPGEYRLRSTGEIVVDPDYTVSWTVSAADPGEESGSSDAR
jgi:hypothetical protein